MRSRRGTAWSVVAVLGLVLSVVVLAPSPPASAASGVTLVGAGYGHGIGMSQYGARYRAEAGHTVSQILSAYYPGTSLGTGTDEEKLRIRIESDTDDITAVRAEPGLRLGTSARVIALPTTVAGGTPTQWRIRISSNRLIAEALVGGTWRSSGSTAVTSLLTDARQVDFTSTDGAVRLVLPSADREYVGAVRAVRPPGTTTSLRTVVVSRIKNYLPSVVAAEMPTSWHARALQAQAVAARTYAKFDADSKSSTSYYDTCDTTSCQVFSGRAHYTSGGSLIRTWTVASTTAATQATAGRFVSYQGAPAFTQFSASNGGYSIAGSRPYLRAAPDPYDRYPTWRQSVSASTFERAYPSIGDFLGLSVRRDGRGSYGGRAVEVRVSGTSGSVTVTGSQLRSALGLRSTLFGTGHGPAVADVVGDSRPDLVGTGASGRTYLLHGAGSAGVDGRTTLTGIPSQRRPVAVTSWMTGRSASEVLTVDRTTGDLIAYPVASSGAVGTAARLHSGTWTRYEMFVGVVDFGGNGRPGFLARGVATGKLYYFESDGDGGLAPGRVVSGWGTGAGVVAATAAGDWDGDGNPDVAVLGRSGTLWLYPGTGGGGFGAREPISTHPGWAARTDLTGGGDFDRDGRIDLLSVDGDGRLFLNARGDDGGVRPGRLLEPTWYYRLLS